MRYSIEPKDRIYVKGYGFLKTASKRAIQKTAEATDDLIGNKIANKITGRASPKDVSVSTELHPKKSTKELSKDETEVDEKRVTIKKRYVSPEERQQIINGLRLV